MLHPELINFMKETTPELNPMLAEGLATHQMVYAERYIDEVFKSAARDFPQGLTYAGCQRCTPEEEFMEAVKHNGSKRGGVKRSRKTHETARSDIYLMKYFFKFNGKLLDPRYIYLPYVSQAGSIYISGSRFTISPVIQDRVFSIGTNNIFVRFVRDKITFERTLCAFMADGVRETEQMVHSRIHNEKSTNPTVRAVSSMAHYLFCKYGFTESFKRFTGTEPVVAENFDPALYPSDMWVICSTIYSGHGMRPKGYGRGSSKEFYEASKLKVAVRRDQYTPMVKAMIGAFFYVVDHFPQQMKAEYVDKQLQWQVLMGHILFSGGIGAGKLLEKMQSHIHSLDEYVDTIVRANMAEVGIHVSNLYEFFAIIIAKYNEWLLEGSNKINSMYDKELVTVYYALMDITKAIFKFYYKINATAAKKELTEKEIVNTMNAMMTARKIFDLRKDHGEVSSNSYSGDNMAFKITSILVPQSSATRRGASKGSDRGSIGDPSKKFHVSVAEIGSYSGMPKSDPSGHGKLNHHTKIDHKGRIVRNPKLIPLLDEVQSLISRQHRDTTPGVDVASD